MMSLLANISVGCIGVGNMGSAIVTGLAKSMEFKSIACYDANREKLKDIQKRMGVRSAPSVTDLCRASDIVILAVKPDTIPAVLEEIKNLCNDKILVSIAAGVSIGSMEMVMPPSQKIVRVMPNTPALVGKGMSVLSPNTHVDEASLKIVEEIFSLIGSVMVLPEKLMNAVTGLSGSGPAYVFTLIQAMADGGVKMGIPRDKSLILAAQTVAGSAEMILKTAEDPMALRGRVTSPGGTTIDAVHVLERSGFSGIVMDAIETATLKAVKMEERKS